MDGTITIGTEINTKEFDSQIKYIESRMNDIEDKLKSADMGFEVGDVNKLEAEYEKLGNQLIGLKQKQEKYNQSINEAQSQGFEKIKNSINDIGNRLTSVTRKVGRWALAVFGVRSAYMFVRNAINTITQDDEQLANDIQAMKTALAYTIEPLVRKIVDLAKTLMSYVGYIVKAWTGRDIFANTNKSLRSTVKSAKQLEKTSASFDKFNKLSSNKSSSSGGSLLSGKSSKMDVPKWIKWIAKNGDKVKTILIGIASALAGIKLGLTGIQGIGLGIALYGIMTTISNIIKFLKDPTFKNFIKILESIAIAVGGIAVLFGSWPVAVGSVIALVILKLLECYDKVIKIFNGIINWFDTSFRDKMVYLFGPIGHIITDAFLLPIETIKSLFESLFGGIKKVVTGIIQIFTVDFKTGIKKAFEGIKDILNAPFKALITIINAVIKAVNNLTGSKIKLIQLGKIEAYGKSSGGGFRAKGGIYYPKLASGGIINQPGRGVAYHGATIGERGAEAVVPLTDTAQMELLGESIGKHVKFNADITLELESRVLAKVMKEINNESKFARNGG